MVKVRNMTSPSGNKVANQFVIQTPDGWYFQSYNTLIAFKSYDGSIKLDRNAWDYSTTTSKYRNMFLDMKKAETEKLIKAGEIQLVDLNQ
jgi:hypothetical protein